MQTHESRIKPAKGKNDTGLNTRNVFSSSPSKQANQLHFGNSTTPNLSNQPNDSTLFPKISIYSGRSTNIQTKLTINKPGDQYEQEADLVADQIMRMPEPRMAGGSGNISKNQQPKIQRMCKQCEEELKTKARTDGAPQVTPQVQAGIHRLTGRGQRLSDHSRYFFESRFGKRFTDVRVHHDTHANRLAESVNARAFTQGNNIVFAHNQFQPETTVGRRLLAHELTHVLQNQTGTLRREANPRNTTLDLCFVPIGRFHLGRVGGVHAVLNIHGTRGLTRVEVDPAQHQGVGDPAAVAEGPGRVAGFHSHVVNSNSARQQGTCQTLTVTQTQADAAIAAASRYEELDVVYEAPGMGPNSNSFGEWVLQAAGISTSGITVPDGALGWGWYQDNPGERSRPPMVARTHRGIAAVCNQPHTSATTIAALIDLIRNAETQLISCGVNDVGERINIIRGIFYGSPWSRDYGTGQSSHIRNAMFNVYSGTDQPQYPLECMDCGTALAIGESQDIRERSGRRVDVGHLLIGLDARRSIIATTLSQPVGQVTGLEASTWAGDLGGGAAQLAMARVRNASRRASTYFRPNEATYSDYGGSINLEGDVAGYAVAAGSASPGDAPPVSIPVGSTIADALDAYFNPAGSTPAGWDNRCRVFITAMGGSFNSTGTLTNRSTVLDYLAEQIHDFGCWYMVNFQRQHHGMNASTLEAASRHMEGAATEIAEIFLSALENCVSNPSRPIVGRANPSPTAAGDPSCLLARGVPEGAELLERGRDYIEQEVAPEARELIEDAESIIRDGERWIEQGRRRFERWRREF